MLACRRCPPLAHVQMSSRHRPRAQAKRMSTTKSHDASQRLPLPSRADLTAISRAGAVPSAPIGAQPHLPPSMLFAHRGQARSSRFALLVLSEQSRSPPSVRLSLVRPSAPPTLFASRYDSQSQRLASPSQSCSIPRS